MPAHRLWMGVRFRGRGGEKRGKENGGGEKEKRENGQRGKEQWLKRKGKMGKEEREYRQGGTVLKAFHGQRFPAVVQ